MRVISAILAAATLAAGAVPAVAGAQPDNSRNEARLAKALEGRVAGEPVRCINLRDIRSSEIIDRTAILYRMHGNKLYVNRPNGASSLDSGDILVTRTIGSQLCNIDNVNLVDRTSRFWSGSVNLDDFVPYTKVETARN